MVKKIVQIEILNKVPKIEAYTYSLIKKGYMKIPQVKMKVLQIIAPNKIS